MPVNVKLIKRNKTNKSCCSKCDNIISNQEYIVDMEELPSDKLPYKVFFWKGDVGYYTDIVIKITDDCIYSKYSKYFYEKI